MFKKIKTHSHHQGFTLIELTNKIGQARRKFASGFTLIELMIVIAILAALATMFMSTFPASQKRGRDTRRRSDLKQYQTSMETYYNRQGSYPAASGNITGQCGALGLTGCPDDPLGGTNHYSISSSATDYVLWAKLESPLLTTAPYIIFCSNGKSGENGTASGPGCPLP